MMNSQSKTATGEQSAGGDVTAAALKVAEILREHAAEGERREHSPTPGLEALKQSGLMGLMVPVEFGGMGASYATMVEVAQIISGACLSTGMIWAMHCQQVAILADHASEALKARILPRVASGAFIASVTTERGKGGHLLTAHAPLSYEDDDVLLYREAPVVTCGAYADAYLMTMRSGEDRPPSDVVMVYADRADVDVTTAGEPRLLGMRGTHNASLLLKGRVPASQILRPPDGFRQIAVATMAPVGHIAWAACWLGSARQALREMIALFRDPTARGSFHVESDLFAERLARVRLELDMVSAYLNTMVSAYAHLRDQHGLDSDCFSAPSFNIQINNLKIIASEHLFQAADALMQIAGLSYGYSQNRRVSLERVFRDLRSASLNYHNDRLLVANGKLTLMDREVTLP